MQAKQILCLNNRRPRGFGLLNKYKPPVATAAVRSKAMMLLIHCLLLLPL